MEDSAVSLGLFGPPALQRGGLRITLPCERRTQLLAWLALRGDWVPRAEAAALLWPELSSTQAHANLRKTLFRLPGLPDLPRAVSVETQGPALRLRLPTDVAAFEAALRQGRDAEALMQMRGELLAGWDGGAGSEAWARWLSFERQRLQAAWRAAALRELGRAEAAAPALALAARLLEQDPLDEAALQAQLQWLARDGRSAAARAAYRGFAQKLARELGVEPGAALRAAHDALAEPVAVQAAATPAPPDAGFVGRAVELHRIAALLARDECRLLCLIGPGGIGKTRLARHAQHALAPHFENGSVFVVLEDVDTPELLYGRLLHELGASRSAAPGDAFTAVAAALAPRQVLLVLDNFETLAEHAPLLQRLLAAGPRIKLLVTSRVRLPVAGEWSLPLEGLPCPDPEDEDRAETFDAVRLFVQTAQRLQPALDAAAERAAIVDICRQVDGLPLAIELAAAWVRLMPAAAIAEELRRGSDLLRTLDSTHPARHASIEQVFEQSWQRLAAAEQQGLARLTVFRGGFTAEAARAVADAALPVLAALLDKSLLHRAGTRLQLHPLVQQLAHQRLQDGVRQRTQAAHAAYFHDLLRQLQRRVAAGEGQALNLIDAEFENCRLAWWHALEHAQADALARMAQVLADHGEHRARFEDGLALLRPLLDAPALQGARALQAVSRAQASFMLYRLARYAEAEALAGHALALARAARARPARLLALRTLASCATSTGRLILARRHYRQALAVARALSQPVAQLLENLSLVEKRLGRYEEALRLAGEALALYRRDAQHAALALGLSNMASLRMFMDDDEAAAALLHEALALSEREGLTSTRAYTLANLSELAFKTHDWPAAQNHAERALEVARSTGLRPLAGWLQVQCARLALRRGQADAARTPLADAARLAQTLGAPALKAALLLGVAEFAEAHGHAAAARRLLASGAEDSTLSMADRDELRAAWARRADLTRPDPPWPALPMHELLRHLADESGAGPSALLALLDAGA